MHEICMDVWNNYDMYLIGGDREAMDDKLLAISSAVIGCKPTADHLRYFNYYPNYYVRGWKPKANIAKKQCSFFCKEINKNCPDAMICHWANFLTKEYLYKREVRSMQLMEDGKNPRIWVLISALYMPIYMVIEYWLLIFKPRLIDSLRNVEVLQKIWHMIKRK